MTTAEAILDGDRNWLDQRKLEWTIEHRLLCKERQQISQRIEELQTILRAFEGVRG